MTLLKYDKSRSNSERTYSERSYSMADERLVRQRRKSGEIYRETVPAYGLSRKNLQRYLEVKFQEELELIDIDQASVPERHFLKIC